MGFSEEHKKQVETMLVEAVITALESGDLAEGDLPAIGNAILSHIDSITSSQELVTFLKKLSSEWPFFSQVLEIEMGKVKAIEEAAVANDVLHMASQGQIEEALQLAKTMTDQ